MNLERMRRREVLRAAAGAIAAPFVAAVTGVGWRSQAAVAAALAPVEPLPTGDLDLGRDLAFGRPGPRTSGSPTGASSASLRRDSDQSRC